MKRYYEGLDAITMDYGDWSIGDCGGIGRVIPVSLLQDLYMGGEMMAGRAGSVGEFGAIYPSMLGFLLYSS